MSAPTDDLPGISVRMRERMAQLKITQAKLALTARVDQATISRCLRGAMTPRPSTVKRLAEALGVTPRWLTDGASTMSPPPAAEHPDAAVLRVCIDLLAGVQARLARRS